LDPSGWPGWPTEPGCGSTPPPNSPPRSALEARLLLGRHRGGCWVRLTAFDQRRPGALLS
jgi:hypothetical protein